MEPEGKYIVVTVLVYSAIQLEVAATFDAAWDEANRKGTKVHRI